MLMTIRADLPVFQAHRPGCQHLNRGTEERFDIEADLTQEAVEAALDREGFGDQAVVIAPCASAPGERMEP